MKNAALSFRVHAVALSLAFVACALLVTADTVAARPLDVKPNGGGGTSSASCTLSTAGVGDQLALAGRGFAPNSQYILFMTSPAGTGATTVDTDSTGTFTYLTWASWPGAYTAQLWNENHHSSMVASCSTAV